MDSKTIAEKVSMPYEESPRLLKDEDIAIAIDADSRKSRIDEEVYDDRVFYSNLIKVCC